LKQKSLNDSRWILLLFIISQPIVLIFGYQAFIQIQSVRDTTEAQLASLSEARVITEHLVLLGEYRGSCSADSLMDGAQSKLNTLCTQSYKKLISIYPDLPALQTSTTSQLFDRITRLNQENIETLHSLYFSSKAMLDKEALYYQLSFEVYRFYPQLIEYLGYAGGSLPLVQLNLKESSIVDRVRGSIAELGNTWTHTSLLFNSSMQSEYVELVKDALGYVDRVAEFREIKLESHSEAQRYQEIADMFTQGTELIRKYAVRADHDALELEEALSERLYAAKQELQLTIALFCLVQLILFITAKRSLQTVRALSASVLAEHEASERLESTLNKQKEMFAIIGHELRTPVATIKMLTVESSWQDADKLIQINEISDNLLHVLEDLRVVISPERALEAKKSEKDSPVEVVTRALSSIEWIVHKKGMNLKFSMPAKSDDLFSFHVQPLRQIVTNLVKNAALHSGGSQLIVSLEIGNSTDNSVIATLRVEDNGKGIPEHLRASVFEAFGRGDTQADGSGLGLFIVKNMAFLMGGVLTYSQSSMGGAAFELVLPMTRAKVELQESAEQPSQNLSLNGLRVLLAEDDLMLRMLTEKLLTKEGVQVHSFENGVLALEAFRPEDYDLVITDLMMPEMNGHELTRAVRTQSSDVIIVAVTAAVLGAETEQFIQEGADFVLPKPITKDSLTEALKEIRNVRYPNA